MVFSMEEVFEMNNAIAPFVGDEMAVLLLVYILMFLGEAEVEVDRATVTSNT